MCKEYVKRGLKAVEVRCRYFDRGERTTLLCAAGMDGTLRVGRKAYNAAARRVRLALSDVLETEDGRLVYAVA